MTEPTRDMVSIAGSGAYELTSQGSLGIWEDGP